MTRREFCTACGTPRAEAPRFCRSCGADLGIIDAGTELTTPRKPDVSPAAPATSPTAAQEARFACPRCRSAVDETTGSPVSPAINVYRCPSCQWVALRCGNVACHSYLQPQEMGYPNTVRYTCVTCGWTGTGTRLFPAPGIATKTPVPRRRNRPPMRRRIRDVFAILTFVLVFCALSWAGLALLRDAISRDGNLILPALLLALPLLWVGVGLARLLGSIAPRLRRHDRVSGWVAVIAAVVLGVGLYSGVRTLAGSSSSVPLSGEGWPAPELTAALGPACSGGLVPGAGTVAASGTQPNHLVVLDMSGRAHEWTGQPPPEWMPATLAGAELVACISARVTAVLEVCRYEGGSDITRYSATRTVAVFEAASGRRLAAFHVTGSPRECQKTEVADLTELRGSVDWAAVERHLDSLVDHGVYQDPDVTGAPSARP